MAKAMQQKRYTDKFQPTDRYIQEQANQTIKKDPVLALVELITNADEAYLRMEQNGLYPTGKILIRIAPRKIGEPIYEIFDNATGMDADEMMNKVKKIGEDVSGLTEETGGRSYFGRGLKECMIAFGKAFIYSIKDGKYYEYSSRGVNLEERPTSRIATSKDYKSLRIKDGSNGTLVRLFAVNPKIKSRPHFSNLSRSLELHYSLRDIMSNPRRIVILQYGAVDYRGNWDIKDEKKLNYQPPKAEEIMLKDLPIKGYDTVARLEVYRADEDIPYVQEKYARQRGFLVASKKAINDIHDFGLGEQSRIFGRVTCNYFDYLLRKEKDSDWLNASRDGIKWGQHEFCKALENAVVRELSPIYKKEQESNDKTKQKYENEETRKRVKEALEAFNKIAREELEEIGIFSGPIKGKDDTGANPTEPPGVIIDPPPKVLKRIPNGFAFIPGFVRMSIEQSKTITIGIELTDSITTDSLIHLSTNTHSVRLKQTKLKISDFLKNQYKVYDGERDITIIKLQTQISCSKSGTEAEILAKCHDKSAKLEVIVQEKSGGGLFTTYEFDPDSPKEQRVQFIRATGIVKIATSAPSIVSYFGPKGERQNSKEAKVLLAELILDACCSELVRLKVSQEGFLDDDPEAISELMKFRINDYKGRFAELIHNIILN